MALDRLTKIDGGGISTTSDYRVGIITASKFVGPFDGSAGNFSGIITASGANFTGNVTIGGTLTYEDVTNIDSVGIITARNGIDCNGDIDVDGHTNLDNISIAGVTTVANDTEFIFGTNATATRPLKIKHQSNNTRNQFTADYIDFNVIDARFKNLGGAQIAQFFAGNAVNLFWNGTQRFSTAAAGANVYGNLQVESTGPYLLLKDTDHNSDFALHCNNGSLQFVDTTNSYTSRMNINSSGNVSIVKDLDVDGHTNLDNVSIAGVTTHDGNVKLNTNKRLQLGSSSQFYMYYQSSGSTFFESGAGGYLIHRYAVPGGGHENMIEARPNSSVLLFFNGSEKIKTVSKGIQVGTGVTIETNGQATFSGITTGTIFKVPDATNVNGATNHIAIGDNSDLKLYHDNNGDAQIFNSTGHLTIVNNTSGKVINLQPKSGANGVIARYEGAVELYHNNVKTFETTSNGAAVFNIQNNQGLDLNGVGNNTCIRFMSTGSSPGHAFRIAYHSLTNYIYGSPALTFDKTDTSGNFDSHIAAISDGGFHLADNKKLHLGDKSSASGDLRIFHDGSNSYVQNVTGNLIFKNNSADYIICNNSDGSVTLLQNTSTRLQTTTSGINVTGEVAASQDYPNFRPALDLNFSLTKKLDPRITFTRDGLASYVDENGDLKYSTNAPRFNHDPLTKECKGLLMEKSKANLLLYSNQMNNGFNRTLEFNTTDVVAPDGTNTAVKMILTSNAYGYAFPWNNNGTDSNRVGRRLSYWIKKGDYDEINLTNGNLLRFTFSTKSFTNSGTYTYREKVEEYPNDWYRVSYTIPEASSNSTLIGKFGGSANNVVAYFWGFQLEESGYETSYIPTNGASVTRAADSAVIDGEEFNEFFSHNGVEFNDYRGTLISFSEEDYYANLTGGRFNKIQLELSNDNKVSLATVGDSSSPYVQGQIKFGTASQIDKTSSGSTFPTIVKHGIAFAKNSGAYTYNGNVVQTDNTMNVGSSTTKYTQLTIGGQPSKTHLKRIIYYTNRISDTQLRNLTS